MNKRREFLQGSDIFVVHVSLPTGNGKSLYYATFLIFLWMYTLLVCTSWAYGIITTIRKPSLIQWLEWFTLLLLLLPYAAYQMAPSDPKNTIDDQKFD